MEDTMLRRIAIACAVLLVAAAGTLSAKGDMVLIEARGEGLPRAVRITDPRIDRFHVWSGPGVNGVAVHEAEGFIANWKQGAAAEPAPQLPRFELAFYAGCHAGANCRSATPTLAYVVTYARDPRSNAGYVYIPGRADAAYAANVRSIYRGVEGRWFRTTDAWDRFVAPFLAGHP
jgi:hypothetical protein